MRADRGVIEGMNRLMGCTAPPLSAEPVTLPPAMHYSIYSTRPPANANQPNPFRPNPASVVGTNDAAVTGVAHGLDALDVTPLLEEPLVVVFSRWSENPAAALAEAIAEAEGGVSTDSAVAALERAQSERDVYLILDQIEEYFLYHADDAGTGSFAEALPALLSAPHRVNVLVALREDSLAKLDRFTGRIPGLFGNTLRLDPLSPY